mgnify:CR=1 FL=1
MLLFVSASIVSSLSVNNVRIDSVGPGDEGVIRIDVENEGNSDVEDVSLRINFPDTIVPIGSSESNVNEIQEDEEEEFVFRFKVSNTILPGTYTLPYELIYKDGSSTKTQNGELGIVVIAQPEIEFSVEAQNPIIGRVGTLEMKLINKGLADARFVSIQLESNGVTFVSDKTAYIGSIDSDDFETASFEVIYNKKRPVIEATIKYRDFDNNEQSFSSDISFATYTPEEATKKGILKKNNLPLYIGTAILIIFLWIIIRKIRKRKKENNL